MSGLCGVMQRMLVTNNLTDGVNDYVKSITRLIRSTAAYLEASSVITCPYKNFVFDTNFVKCFKRKSQDVSRSLSLLIARPEIVGLNN
jgi:hypothetical protein